MLFRSVIAPTLSYPLLTIPICALIAINLGAHYYFVCTVPPGFIEDPPKEPGPSFIWASKSKRKGRPLTGGVRWTDAPRITPSAMTQCNRCNKQRPEVSYIYQSKESHYLSNETREPTTVVSATGVC